MKIHVMYYMPEKGMRNTKVSYDMCAQWEVFIDTASTLTLPFGEVTNHFLVTRPTKRQLRKFKKAHRQALINSIDRYNFEQSWEGIHCDIIGL